MIKLREGFTGAQWAIARSGMFGTSSSALRAHINGAPSSLAPLFATNSRAHALRGKQGNWHAEKVDR